MVCKVEPGSSVEYCLQEQEEYYLGGREPAGQWYCPAGQFGLTDGIAVDNAVFRNFHEGMSADGAEQIGKANASGERVGGYDCQFAAPKSVSILWALADDATRVKIEAAQERAVRAALGLAQQTAQVRTGHNGVNLEKTRVFGATFQHGESRPTEREPGTFRSDPHLHTHTIIFNLGQGEDGGWRALDGRVLMDLQKAMGAEYHAELASILETELGARIERRDVAEARHNGEFEIAGVATDLIEQFSSRRAQIVEALDEKGLKTAEALELADEVALATREGKSDESRTAQRERWAVETAEAGYTWEQIAAQSLGQKLDQAAEAERAKAYEESLLAVAERLTETESVFSQPDLYAAIAAAGAGRGHGAVDVRKIEAVLIKTGTLVELATDSTGATIYSTREMVEIEKQIRDWAAEQATAYPVIHQQEETDVQVSRPRPIDHTFGFAAPFSELDDQQLTVRSEADLHSMRGLRGSPVGRDAGERDLLLQGEAVLHLDDGAADRKNSVRRADVRGLSGPVPAPHTLPSAAVDRYLAARAAAGEGLTAEQGVGLHWIGQHGGSHVVVEGGAGTGKTVSIMQGAADLYHAQGYRVLATAQRWVTTLELAKLKTPDGRRIEGRAAAKWIADYRAGKAQFDRKTVLLVDEAGQMGSREAHALMQIARDTGCRVIWTGDRRQQKSVAAGDPLTVLAHELGSHRLEASQRMQATAADVIGFRENLAAAEAHRRAMVLSVEQRAELVEKYGKTVEASGAVWARKAADDFAYGRAAEALQAFRDHDQLVWTDTHNQALDQAVADWAEYKAEYRTATAVVSAAKHTDVQGLNDRMRAHLREIGQIGADLVTVEAVTPSGDKYRLALALGDQVRIGANLKEVGAYNGMLAIVRNIEPGSKPGHPLLTLDLHTPEGVREIKIETQRLANKNGAVKLAHGYAGTTVLVQGATETAMFGQISCRDRANAAYVIGSRARQLTKLYSSREDEDIGLKRQLPLSQRPSAKFTDQERENHLARALSRAQVKRSTLDFESAAPAEPAAEVRAAMANLAMVRTSMQESDMSTATQSENRKKQEREAAERRASDQKAEAEAEAKQNGISDTREEEIGEDWGVDTSSDLQRHDYLKKLAQWYETHLPQKYEQDVTSVRFDPGTSREVEIGFRDGSTIRDNGAGKIFLDGQATPQKAELMVDLAIAKGLTSLKLRGSQDFKKDLAMACFERGVKVKNGELQPYMAKLARTMPHREGIFANDRVNAAEPQHEASTEDKQRTRHASAPALRMFEAGRLARDLATAGDAIERFGIADKLADLTAADTDPSKHQLATSEREAAAAEIIADPMLTNRAREAGMLERISAIRTADQDQHRQEAEEELEDE